MWRPPATIRCGTSPKPTSSPASTTRKTLRLALYGGKTDPMATYRVNTRGVAKARELIDTHQYRLRSRWGDVQPRAAEQNAFLKVHGWEEYASWHLALTDGAPDETK